MNVAWKGTGEGWASVAKQHLPGVASEVDDEVPPGLPCPHYEDGLPTEGFWLSVDVTVDDLSWERLKAGDDRNGWYEEMPGGKEIFRAKLFERGPCIGYTVVNLIQRMIQLNTRN